MTDGLNGTFTREQVEAALRRLIAADVDYDTHKGLEGLESGTDSYPYLTDAFIGYLKETGS